MNVYRSFCLKQRVDSKHVVSAVFVMLFVTIFAPGADAQTCSFTVAPSAVFPGRIRAKGQRHGDGECGMRLRVD